MDLKMEVYTPSLEFVGILEVHRSVICEEKAFGAGSFSVDSLITDDSKTLLVPGNIIWISENYAGVIEYVQEQSGKEGPYITVKGPDLTGILGQRILWGQYNLTGTAPAIMHNLVNDSCISPTRGATEARKIPGLVSLDVPTGGDVIRVQKTGGTLLEALEELGAAFNVSFGVRFNPAIPRMEFWTRWGQNRSINQDTNDPVFYSTELDDVLSSEYSYNAQDWRNVALVAGEGEGDDRVMVIVNADVTPAPIPPPPGTKYTITLSVDPEGSGVATGGGQINEGESVTVIATPSSGYTFSAWKENGQTVSANASYTFTASANRSLTAVFAVASRLPQGYTEIQYIASDNNSAINTGVKPTETVRITIDVEPLSEGTTSDKLFCFSNGFNFNSNYSYLFGAIWKSGVYVYRGGAWSNPSKSPIVLSNNRNHRRMTIVIDYLNKKASIVDETEITLTLVSDTGWLNTITLLNNSGKTSGLDAKLYSCKIELSSSAVRDFVPCIAPSGDVGLYDLVGDKFYANAGTGIFTPGPSV